MAAMLMMKVPTLELSDIVSDEYSMDMVGRALFRILIDS